MIHILVGALMMVAPQSKTDTTISVKPDARVDVQNFAGSITVKTWDKPQIHIVGSHSRRDRIEVGGSESSVRIRTGSSGAMAFAVDMELTVPTGVTLKLGGTYTDIQAEGLKGAITAETMSGDVRVSGGANNIVLSSVEGPISLEKAN